MVVNCLLDKNSKKSFCSLMFGTVCKAHPVSSFNILFTSVKSGILSSIGETTFALSEKSEKINFNVETILNANYRTDIIEEKYFVIESFEQLINSLPEIEKQLAILCSEELQK